MNECNQSPCFEDTLQILDGEGPFTVFAPNDDALAAYIVEVGPPLTPYPTPIPGAKGLRSDVVVISCF